MVPAKIKCNLGTILYDRGISFRQLEIMTGVSKSMLNAMANNTREPSLSVAFAVAAALNVTLEELFSYEK